MYKSRSQSLCLLCKYARSYGVDGCGKRRLIFSFIDCRVSGRIDDQVLSNERMIQARWIMSETHSGWHFASAMHRRTWSVMYV